VTLFNYRLNMIQLAKGNILEAATEALVNTVNTKGVMGKGIALQFKKAFPDVFASYKKACDTGEVRIGKMHIFRCTEENGPRYIINFPTKDDWKKESRIEYIQEGLKSLTETIRELKISSIAIPPLGCGLGGLNWKDVLPLIQATFEAMPDVVVMLYPPLGALATSQMPNSNAPSIGNPDTEKSATSTKQEENLTIPHGTTLITDRSFINLDWTKQDHQGLTFKNCTIINSNFSAANLDGLRLENCNVFNTNFEKASIKDGFFEDCTFYEKQHQQGCNFSLADLRQTEFHRCNISMNNFKRANLFQITINDSRAQGCNFQFANFVHIVSRTALFSAAYLTKTDFRYSNFEGVYLQKCDLSESKFVAVIFTRANLEEADLTSTDFAPNEYDGLSLFKADFRNAEIRNIDVRKLDFSGVKIFEWQQAVFIENLGIITYPDKPG